MNWKVKITKVIILLAFYVIGFSFFFWLFKILYLDFLYRYGFEKAVFISFSALTSCIFMLHITGGSK